MDSINNDIKELYNFFEVVVNMIPDNTNVIEHRKRPSDNKPGINHHTKKSKIITPQVKAMQKFQKGQNNMEDSDVDEEQAKMHLSKIQTNCSIEELHERLHKKIEEKRLQRQPKFPKKVRKKRPFKNKKGKEISEEINDVGIAETEANLDSSSSVQEVKQNNSDALLTKEGKVVFSKFDFSQMVGQVSKKKVNKKYKLPTGKNYELLLLKANKEKERIEKLKQDDPQKASEEIEKTTWAKAVAKAEGLRLKDDPELLKKSLKQKLAKKNRSAKQWEERNKRTLENMQKKQEKRQANLKKRKDHKKNQKIMKRIKKAPGF